MDTQKPISPAILIVAVVLLLGFVAFMAFRSFGGGDGASEAAGAGATTVAPAQQRYPDGTPVPYTAAPTGATPGDPASVRR